MAETTHSENAELYGVTIEHEVARRALKLGRDAFAKALKAGEIPSIKVGQRRRVLGVPFRKMVGLPERAPQHEATAA